MAQKWLINETRRLKATFEPGAKDDPPTEPVKVFATYPDGSAAIEDEAATKDEDASTDSKWVYYYDFTPTKAGRYLEYTFREAGGGAEPGQAVIHIDKSKTP